MAIKDHLLTYFINRWNMYEYTRGWLKGDCPYCGKEDKFGVHIGNNRTNCFSCGPHESPLRVVAHIEDINIREARAKIGTFEGLKYREEVIKEYEHVDVVFPEYYKPLKYGDSIVAKGARNYMGKKRGLDIDRLHDNGFGYCDDGEYFGYIIMPYYVNGKLVYYQTRNFMGSGAKFKNPPVEEFGIGKSNILYNVDSLWLYNSTHIVESVINAETIGDNAIASSGKSLSPKQITTIIASPVKRVTILLDPDAFYTKAIPLAFTLLPYKQVKLVNLPEGQDVNTFGRTRTLAMKRRQHYLTYAELLKIKHKTELELYYGT